MLINRGISPLLLSQQKPCKSFLTRLGQEYVLVWQHVSQLWKVFFNDLESDYRFAFPTCLQAWSMFLISPSHEACLLSAEHGLAYPLQINEKKTARKEKGLMRIFTSTAIAAKILATIWTTTAGNFPFSPQRRRTGNKQWLLESHFLYIKAEHHNARISL